MELCVFVSAAEGVSAAAQSGADAVSARIAVGSRRGLSSDEIFGAARFCRVRGVRLYAELDYRPSDAELPDAVAAARMAWLNGCDAIIAGDPGLILALRRAVPDALIHAGSIMNTHSAEGVAVAAAMGASRALLSAKLSREDISAAVKDAKIETLLPVHGRLSASVIGTELAGMPELHSGVEDSRALEVEASGLRPFALPDLSLVYHAEELRSLGVTALGIDGTDRRPEYISAVTMLYSRAVFAGRLPDEDELGVLNVIEPAPGLTDAFYTGKCELELTGKLPEAAREDSVFLASLRKGYLRREFQRVPVTFTAEVALGKPLRLAAEDDRGNVTVTEGGRTELAFHRELTPTTLQTELYKTAGTPFLCESVRCRIAKGVYVSPEDIAVCRDKVLSELMERRAAAPERKAGEFRAPAKISNVSQTPVLTVSVRKISQLSPRMLELAPPVIYVPVGEIRENETVLSQYIAHEGVEVVASLPPVTVPGDLAALTARLLSARQLGIESVEVQCLGQALFARKLGFGIRGGIGLGAVSSADLDALRAFGMESVLLSPTLSSERVNALSKAVPSELTVYGRLPLITAEPFTASGLSGNYYESLSAVPDDNGLAMPITASPSGSVVWSAKKLYLARRSREYMNAGLWGVRLAFSTENAEECAKIAERFVGRGSYFPASYTTGAF